jgi:zinc protease
VCSATRLGPSLKAPVEPGLASSVAAFGLPLKEVGAMAFLAEVPLDHDLEKASTGLSATVEGLSAAPPTAEEVGRARNQILRDLEIAFADPSRLGVELSDSIAVGDWRLIFLFRDEIEKVTPEQVQSAALKYLKPSNRTAGLFVPTAAPERAEITLPPDVQSLVGSYQGRAALAAGEVFDPTPQNIAARTQVETLANGMAGAAPPEGTRRGRGRSTTLRIGRRLTPEQGCDHRRRRGDACGSSSMTRQQIQDSSGRAELRRDPGGCRRSEREREDQGASRHVRGCLRLVRTCSAIRCSRRPSSSNS